MSVIKISFPEVMTSDQKNNIYHDILTKIPECIQAAVHGIKVLMDERQLGNVFSVDGNYNYLDLCSSK